MSDFGGKTISGDINRFSEAPPTQDDPQVFLDALDKVLECPGVEAVRWNQYTPYFNDGDACTFSIYSAYVKIKGDDEEVGDYGNGFRSTYDLYDYDPEAGDTYETRRKFNQIGDFPAKMIHDSLSEFEGVLESGKHYVVLNEKFGDPAQVTATRDGFEVEFYEHD